MFRQLARITPGGGAALVQLHPSELVFLLEVAWQRMVGVNPAAPPPAPPLGHPDHRTELPGFPLQAAAAGAIGLAANPITALGIQAALRWDHLIYAYMLENTRVYEVFRRVVHEFVHGEKLGAPRTATQLWLRNTEELFYRDPPAFSIVAVNSHIRSDMRASRRNAYQRMFGMDLNHGADDNTPYPYVRAESANSEFVATFEELLREVWVGIQFVSATAAANPTDNAKIALLAEKLRDMLRSRRQHGNLSREEFAFVSMMSWFHMTLETEPALSVIEDLKAEVTGPEQRLFRIAQRVGLPAHGLTKSYLDLADPMSRILIQIEMDTYNSPAAVAALYTPGSLYPVGLPGPGPEGDMRTIITHWSVITGRDVKARKVVPS